MFHRIKGNRHISAGILTFMALSRSQRDTSFIWMLVLLFAMYACARLLEIVPTQIPRMAIVALDVLSAMIFALIAGSRHYGLRAMLVFVAICVIVGNVIENIGVATGFPYGHYYFVELMGPKLFHVPILLGLAYIGMAYVAFTLAHVILGTASASDSPTRLGMISLLAACIMTAWDLAQDPVWATVLHGWVWRDGGPWFGVPLSNYLGWLGTNFLISLFFAYYLRSSDRLVHVPSRAQAAPAIVFYALCALGNICQLISRAASNVVFDPTGRAWRVADILSASALISVLVMGGFAAIAGVRTLRSSVATD